MYIETPSPQAPPTGGSDSGKLTRFERLGFWLILVTGAAFGIFHAWLFRENTHPDYGITLLMAKHIAAGRDFPVFFYGQAYLGSIESYFAALLCLIFGTSSFVIACGHAFAWFLILPLVWRWAREVAGPRAGLIAMLFCAFYFPNPFIKHGGYAMTVVCSTLTLWLVARTLVREVRGERTGARDYFIIGLSAGLGWWTDQLVAASLATAALMLFIVLRFRVFLPRVSVTGVAGFLLGGLPFWIWNAQNDWATWNFQNAVGRTPMLFGLKMFFVRLYADACGLGGLHPMIIQQAIIVFIFAGMIALFVRGLKLKDGWIHPLTWILFVIVSALVASPTYFIAHKVTRYLTPQLPIIAVALGCIIASVRSRVPGLLLLLIPLLDLYSNFSAVVFSFDRQKAKAVPPFYPEYIQLVDAMASNGVRHAYIKEGANALNFYGNERVEFSSIYNKLPVDRYAAYTQDAEADDHPAFAAGFFGIRDFLAYAGGGAKEVKLKKNAFGVFHFDFVPPSAAIAEMPPDAVRSIAGKDGAELKSVLLDRTHSTIWTAGASNAPDNAIDIAFAAPSEVCGLRLYGTSPLGYPVSWKLERSDDNGQTWRPLIEKAAFTPFQWSGPRPYWGVNHHHLAIRFAPCTTTRLRLTPLEISDRAPWQIADLQILAPAPEPPPPDISAVAKILHERRITRLYSDRWEANAIHAADKEIATDLDPEIFGESKSLHTTMRFKPVTAILVSRDNAPATRDALALKKITARETPIGPWLLFDFPGDNWKPGYATGTGLVWTGCTCLASP